MMRLHVLNSLGRRTTRGYAMQRCVSCFVIYSALAVLMS